MSAAYTSAAAAAAPHIRPQQQRSPTSVASPDNNAARTSSKPTSAAAAKAAASGAALGAAAAASIGRAGGGGGSNVTPPSKQQQTKKKRTNNITAAAARAKHPEMTVDKRIIDELLLVCGVIGSTTASAEGATAADGSNNAASKGAPNANNAPEFIPVTDCLNWLQDLQRALRRDHDQFRPIALLLGQWRIVANFGYFDQAVEVSLRSIDLVLQCGGGVVLWCLIHC
eukprot:scaffold1055_cov297-Alexandrium_tamarense.AAC.1